MKTTQKTALITGASRGIGSAVAQDLSRRGYELILVSRNKEALEALSRSLPGPSTTLICDLSEKEEIKSLGQRLRNPEQKVFQGDLCVLVNNAGIIERQELIDSTDNHWHRQMNINFFAPVALTRELLPLLEASSPSVVINMASTLGLRPLAATGAYSCSKAALIHWTQILALELAAKKIRVNCVCPGIVDTPIQAFHQASEDSEVRQQAQRLQPLGRVGKPEEVAAAVGYFCLPESEWTTGTVLTVDGGISLL